MDDGILFLLVAGPPTPGQPASGAATPQPISADHSRIVSRNVSAQAWQLVGALTRQPGDRRSYQHDGNLYHLLVAADGGACLCVVREGFPAAQAFGCLTAAAEAYAACTGGHRDRERLRAEVRVIADRFSDGNVSKVRRIQQQVCDVRGVIADNVDRMLDRTGKIDDIAYRAEALEEEATQFRTHAGRIKRAAYVKRIVIAIVLVLVLLLAAFITFVLVCHKGRFDLHLAECF